MPRGKRSKSAASELPALVDPRLIRALDHVLRQHILLAAVQGEFSPNELSKALNERLSQVSYHVRVLRDACEGMIEETRSVPRRGAVEHYYRASEKTLFPAKTWRRLKKGLRAVVGAGQASDLFNDLAEALKAGKLQGAHDHIVRTPLALDAEGRRNVQAIAERATGEVEDEQRAVAERMAKADGNAEKTIGCTFALLAFEAVWDPVDLRTAAAQAEVEGAASTDGTSDAGHDGSGSKSAGAKQGQQGK